jgi:hypothetical protein
MERIGQAQPQARALASSSTMLMALGVVAALGGCGLPAHMELVKGVEPANEDTDVRFRTTYYFRVFDVCDKQGIGEAATQQASLFPPERPSGQLRVLKDSIYRFRMTGKASSLFSKVNFESGTLASYQIDPFGANVAFDQTNGQFYFKSQADVQADARQDASFRNIERYRKLKEEFAKDSPMQDAIDALIREELGGLNAAASQTAGSGTTVAKTLLVRQVRDAYAAALVAAGDALLATADAEAAVNPGDPDIQSSRAQGTIYRSETAKGLNPTADATQNSVDALLKSALTDPTNAASLDKVVASATAAVKKARDAAEAAQTKAQHAQDDAKASIQAAAAKAKADEADRAVAEKQALVTLAQADDQQAQEQAKAAPDDAGLKAKAARTATTLAGAMAARDVAKQANTVAQADTAKAGAADPLAQSKAKAAAENLAAAQAALTRAQAGLASLQQRRQELLTLQGVQVSGRGARGSAAQGPAATVAGGEGGECPSGSTKQRGFQILGPEGLRTFNQDDRLIMAMYSDGKPLISVMNDLSGRVLNQKSSTADDLLPLVTERVSIGAAKDALVAQKPARPEDAPAALQKVIDAFAAEQARQQVPQ